MAKRFDAIYARQSVDKKDSVSIETQIEACKTKCDKNPVIYDADKGFSGKNTDRPDLQRLINDIEHNTIKKVVVYKLDRISRNITDFYKLYEIMQAHNCEFVSYEDNFDTTTIMGRAMMGILVVFAQMERENTVVRVRDNYHYRIKDGRWASGKAPFGFSNGKADGKPTLIPVEEEIDAVKYMFNAYSSDSNISLGKIQQHLIDAGINGHQGKGFARTTIGRILSNPIYVQADKRLYQYYKSKQVIFVNDKKEWNGAVSCELIGKKDMSRKVENLKGCTVYLTNVKPVIDSETFIIVQQRLAQNSALASDNSPNNNLKELSGLIKCKECGSAIKMQKFPTFTCTGRSQKKICSVSLAGVKLDDVRNAVGVEVQAYLDNIDTKRKETEKRINKINKEIKDLTDRQERLLQLVESGEVGAVVATSRLEEIQNKLNELELQRNLGINKSDLYDKRFGLDEFTKMSKRIDYLSLDAEKRQTLLRILVDKILLDKDGNISIKWKE